MKKTVRKQGLSCFLAGVMALGLTMPANAVTKMPSSKMDSPFAAMYDSDVLFLEEAEKMLKMELVEKYWTGGETVDVTDFLPPKGLGLKKQYASVSQDLLKDSAISALSGQVLSAMKTDSSEVFEDLQLEEQDQERIQQLYEDSRVDSYIVKYKDMGSETQLMNKIQIAEVVEASAIELPSIELQVTIAEEIRTVPRTEDIESNRQKIQERENLTSEEYNLLEEELATEDDVESFVQDDTSKDEALDLADVIAKNEDDLNNKDEDNYLTVEDDKMIVTKSETDRDTELLQRIVLSEKVNPAEFALQLEVAGAADDIEYIQPDFLFFYAGLDLVVKEVNGGTENVESPKEQPSEEDGSGEEPEESSDTDEDADKDMDIEEENDNDGEESKDENSEEPEEDSAEDELSEEERLERERLEAERLEAERLERERLEEELRKLLEMEQLASKTVIVALIDTGVDVNHSALQDNLMQGWNFVGNSEDVFDVKNPMQSSHGTHIAGIIAENSINDQVQILPLQVFGPNGAYTSDIIAAILCAEENGAQVVNMSFGSSSYNRALEETMAQSNMLFVSAVGNARSDLEQAPVYPAAFQLDNMISVTSLNQDKGFSYYSNYSTTLVDIAAQGRDVESALPGEQYGLQSGTSMAAGFVSAAAGSVLTQELNMSAVELKQRLVQTADMYEHLENKVGEGRSLNQTNAVLNYTQTEMTSRNYEEDFDVHGYQPTPEENWALFADKMIVDISAGEEHSLVLCSDGTVWAWGDGFSGTLGNGSNESSDIPVRVIGLEDVIAISTRNSHSLALKSDGTVWAWGYNFYGQLGDGSKTSRAVPVQVININNVTEISAGDSQSMALKG